MNDIYHKKLSIMLNDDIDYIKACQYQDSNDPIEYWKYCLYFHPKNYRKIFEEKFGKNNFKMEEIVEMECDDCNIDSNLGGHIASYNRFETEALNNVNVSSDQDVINKKLTEGKLYIKNNIFCDKNNPTGLQVINRIGINYDDGFIDNSILTGSGVTRDMIGSNTILDDVNLCDPETNKMLIMAPNMYADSIANISFPKTLAEDCPSQYLFEQRNKFIESFEPYPEFSEASSLVLDKAINPSIMSFNININGIYAFNEVFGFCNYTGTMFPDMSATVLMLTYFAHNVLTLLMPKQIVLIMDSYHGIDIPTKHGEYIPAITRKGNNRQEYFNPADIPDYSNKMNYIISMMKNIAAGQMFPELSSMRNVTQNGFYLKMTITPAMTIINFLFHKNPNVRLILHLNTIDNMLIEDGERRSIYPSKYIDECNPYWSVNRDHDTASDVIKSIGNNYYAQLYGMSGGELENFMRINHISVDDDSFDPNLKDELTIESPSELNKYL